MHYNILCSFLKAKFYKLIFRPFNVKLSYGDKLTLSKMYNPPAVIPVEIENFNYNAKDSYSVLNFFLYSLVAFLVLILIILIFKKLY